MEIVDTAYYDSLAIAIRLQTHLGTAARGEIHLFAYLACLLSLYDEKPASGWGYDFSVTKQGAIYAREIDKVLDGLWRSGCIHWHTDDLYFEVSERGSREHNILNEFQQYSTRRRYIDGACSSLLALPIGTIRSALLSQQEMQNAAQLSQYRPLLTVFSQNRLYQEFSDLSSAIGVRVQDLMVPAVVWLTYLSKVQAAENTD